MSNRTFTPEEWARLCHLLMERLDSRLIFMEEALRGIVTSYPGGEITVSAAALDGVCYMAEDMRKELDEALTILDF